jgi:hypothetical protein
MKRPLAIAALIVAGLFVLWLWNRGGLPVATLQDFEASTGRSTFSGAAKLDSAGDPADTGGQPTETTPSSGAAKPQEETVDRPATLRAILIDAATGQPCPGGISLTYRAVSAGSGPVARSTFNWEPEVTLADVPPGEWGVIATASESRMAAARIALAAGEKKEITLRLGPSAELLLKNADATQMVYAHPSVDGILLEEFGVEGGGEQRVHVPPGRIAVKITNARDETLHESEVTIAAGEVRELSYP